MIEYEYRIVLFVPNYSNSSNSIRIVVSLSNIVFIRILVRIVFGTQKMNEYEYRIPLFGPNYSKSRIVRIIRPNTAGLTQCVLAPRQSAAKKVQRSS